MVCRAGSFEPEVVSIPLRWLLVDGDAWLETRRFKGQDSPMVYFRLREGEFASIDIRRTADKFLFRGFSCWLSRVSEDYPDPLRPSPALIDYTQQINVQLFDWREKFLPGWMGRIYHRRLYRDDALWVLSCFRDCFKREAEYCQQPVEV